MTKEGVRYWQSEASQDWPDAIWADGKKHRLIYEDQVIAGIGKWLYQNSFIPNEGLLLDIGSGPSTLDLLGKDVVKRTFAADISPFLLQRNPLPEHQKILMDVGRDHFPKSLHSQIALAVSARCARYLDNRGKIHVASEVKKILGKQGTYMIIDIKSSPHAITVGETSPFDIQAERLLLVRTGFHSIRTGNFIVSVHDSKFGGTEYSFHEYIVGSK